MPLGTLKEQSVITLQSMHWSERSQRKHVMLKLLVSGATIAHALCSHK